MILRKIENIQISIENIFAWIAAALILFMTLLTTVDVILRYIFNSPLAGVISLCQMISVGIIYLSIAWVQQRKGHIRVDLLIEKIKGNVKTVIEISTLLIALAAFGMLFLKSGQYAWTSWVTGDYEMGLIEYPFWPAKTALFVGVGILSLRLITDICHHVSELRRNSAQWILLLLSSFIPLSIIILFLVTGSFGMKFEPTSVGWALLVLMGFIIFGGLPVAFALLALSIIGYWIIAGPARTMSIVAIATYADVSSYTLSVVPLFILMGNCVYQAGFAESLYLAAQKWVGHMPGSLAQATIVGGTIFGAACGSGPASTATLTKVCLPAMINFGIDRKLAVGTVAAVGPIAQMIPPSIVMVIYGIITDQSIAKLLIAGIIPGIIAALWFMIMIYIRVRLNPELAPQVAKRAPWKERILSLRHIWHIGLLAVIVMGGIYSGMFTPTEAGALGASGAIGLGIMTRRLSLGKMKEALKDTLQITSMIFLIIAAAMVFGYFLGISRIPSEVSSMIIGLNVPRGYILAGIIVMYLIAGCFIDMIAFAFLTLPIIYPAVVQLGYDPIWFGVITVHMFEVALITPPFGLSLFIIHGMSGIPMKEIIQGIIWFTVMDIVILLTFVLFPQCATWLPSLMGP